MSARIRPRRGDRPPARRPRPFRLALFASVGLLLLVPPVAPGSIGGPTSGERSGVLASPAVVPDNLSGSWTLLAMPPDQPIARSNAALAFDNAQGLGLLFGGRDPNGTLLNDTWVNDGDHLGHWADQEVTRSPPALTNAGLVYDATTGAFLLFGGRLSSGEAYGGTWEFANFDWIDLSANLSVSPPPDPGPTLAYDRLDGTVLLLSSAEGTWTFSGTSWTQLTPSVAPSPRSLAGAGIDPATGGVLVFGGSETVGSSGRLLNDTWRFAGGTWTNLPQSVAPPPQARPTLAYDPRLPGLLLVMETGADPTWTYTTSGWSEAPVVPAPAARAGASFYFDSNTAYDILFGGADASGHTFREAWGWSVPPATGELTLGAAAIGTSTWLEIGAVAAVPILVALLLRYRPPRTKPVDAPERAPAGAPA